jgi:hypothetical protein
MAMTWSGVEIFERKYMTLPREEVRDESRVAPSIMESWKWL